MEGRPHRVQGGAGLLPHPIGPEVPRPVVGHPADDGEFRIRLPAEADEGIPLVVLEKDVVPGHVLLDERVLQHQRLELAAHDDGVEVVHQPHHGVRLDVVAPARLKILAHPVFQLFGLAHVDDLAVLPVHQVDPGSQRQAVGFFQQFFLCHITTSNWQCAPFVTSPWTSIEIKQNLLLQQERPDPFTDRFILVIMNIMRTVQFYIFPFIHL